MAVRMRFASRFLHPLQGDVVDPQHRDALERRMRSFLPNRFICMDAGTYVLRHERVYSCIQTRMVVFMDADTYVSIHACRCPYDRTHALSDDQADDHSTARVLTLPYCPDHGHIR